MTGDWQWRYADAVHSRMSADGKISTLCVPKRPAMAGYTRNAFSGDWQWQDSAAVRSRVLDDGKMLAKCASQRPTVAGLRPNALLV